MSTELPTATRILGVGVRPVGYEAAIRQVLAWAGAVEGRYVCVANVHSLMEAHDVPRFKEVLNAADMVVPDGMPLVWMMRRKGSRAQKRVYGPELMRSTLAAAEKAGMSIGLYGSTDKVMERLTNRLAQEYPRLHIAFSESPPFKELSAAEDDMVCRRIQDAGVRILFVALGCPKQELWMASHRGKISGVMIGVGAAFDFLAAAKPQAPRWMQGAGLEWLFRLVTEPRRLWKRYLFHNPRFVLLAAAELLHLRSS